MNTTAKFSIFVTLQDMDVVKFHEKVITFRKANEGKILLETISGSSMPFQSGNGAGSVLVMNAIWEIECTEQAYKQWKFGQSLGIKS